MRRHGFTLVELLVVVAIIALLISILLPALSKAREIAKATVCMSTHRQLVVACLTYGAEFRGHFPGAESYDPNNAYVPWYKFYDGTRETTYLSMPAASWRCPKNTSGQYGLYFRRNIWWNGAPDLDATFMRQVAWGTHSFAYFDSMKFIEPANTALTADTSAGVATPQVIAKGSLKYSNVIETSGPGPACGVWMPHQGKTNMAFGDGHAQYADGGDLLRVVNGQLKNNAAAGGIRYWKLEDGTEMFN